MNKIHNLFLMLPLLGALALGGCGDSTILAEGGIGGTGISTGTVTDIASISVNGVKFDTDNAAIYVEGVRVDDPSLADGNKAFLEGEGFSKGQVVRVVGSFNADGKSGTANEVYYNDSVEGPVDPLVGITTIDANTSEFVVMGQTIIRDSQTVLEGAPTVEINDVIEVSGLRDDAGKIRAGYIRNITVSGQDPDSSNENEVKGVIGSVTANLKFTIESLTIDYTNADMTDIPGGIPLVGMQVEVKGTFNGGELDATRVELEDDIDGLSDDEVEYEGIVTDTSTFATDGKFTLGTETVQTNANTQYKSGLIADIADGVRLEVEGYLQGSILIAEEISFHDAIEIDATVESHSFIDGVVSIRLDGLPAITVQVNSVSDIEIEGVSDPLVDDLNNSLTNGNSDYVQVRGRVTAPGIVYAEEIKAELWDSGDPPKIKLQGPVDEINGYVVKILGVDIDASGIPDYNYEDINEQLITQSEFFATVVVGNIVGAEGEWNGSSIDWKELEIEDEE